MADNTIHIDGSYGEGGGQILRTCLALSCALVKPVEIVNIRKARDKPGLQPQHLTAVHAAQKISGGTAEGAALSSTALRFVPRRISGGSYHFDVSAIKGSAGSSSLVIQTILLPLFFADIPSTVTVMGGTHVPWSPTFHYLKYVFLHMLSRLNANAEVNIERWGWYPAGGGRVIAKIRPGKEFPAITITERGKLKRVAGISAVSNLPIDIAARQRNQAIKLLSQRGIDAHIEIVNAPSIGKGTLFFLLAEFENVSAGFDSLGAIGKRAETVADEACRGMFEYLDRSGSFDPHLADQLVPYLALAKGTSEFSTTIITTHLLTNIWAVKQFLDVDIMVEGKEGEAGKVRIKSRSDRAAQYRLKL